MNSPISIRRASLGDAEALVHMRLTLQLESGHLAQDTMVTALTQATHQYLMEALPKETFIAWVAEAEGKIVASSGLIFFQKPPSENNLSGLEAYILKKPALFPKQDTPLKWNYCGKRAIPNKLRRDEYHQIHQKGLRGNQKLVNRTHVCVYFHRR